MKTEEVLETAGEFGAGISAGGNLIDNDPLVAAIFAAVTHRGGKPIEKLRAVIRAGKIAEAYTCGGMASDAFMATFGEGD
jgi:uncharacterized Ntn-hydrolase superfamily protein